MFIARVDFDITSIYNPAILRIVSHRLFDRQFLVAVI